MSDPSLADKRAFLLRPDSYPEPASAVALRETHMSCVFLTDKHAWKFKKPMREDYLDFSTLDLRRLNCEREILLNRRLAGDVYLKLASLTVDEEGALHLNGRGKTVEWLVQMRRLPEAKMLDVAISNGTVRPEDAIRIGNRLACFYKLAPAAPLPPADYLRQLRADVESSACELSRYELPRGKVETVRRDAIALLDRHRSMLGLRAGKLVDAHGDLRPEHVCLEPEPVIIDCLEFSDALRVLDPVSELSFFSLECDRLGASWIGNEVLEVYQEETGDHVSSELIGFYKRQHALTRAKIAVWHLKDSAAHAEKWIARANDYLHRAELLQ